MPPSRTLAAAGLAILATSAAAHAQSPTDPARPPGRGVHGVVWDSTADRPLGGADVQLANAAAPSSAARSATSDSMGHFEFGPLPDGRYYITFFHPRLDSLGLTASTHVVAAASDAPVVLAIPPAERITALHCNGQDGGTVVGHLLDARTRQPIPGVVVAKWVQLVTEGKSLRVAHPSRSARASDEGWFALCGLPIDAEINLTAIHDADTSGAVVVTVPASGLAQRTLTVGGAPARVAGHVTTADGQPLPGARVRVSGTRAEVVTDVQGAFVLDSVPGGSRVIETRKIGYWPDRRVTDVSEGAPPLSVTLATMKSVLDTVKVVATRQSSTAFDFARRKQHSGGGHFFDQEDIERSSAMETTDLLRRVPSLEIVPVFRKGQTHYYLRYRGGTFGGAYCLPTVFVDGMRMQIEDMTDINHLAPKHRITGVEVYSGSSVPAEYMGQNGCVTLLYWTEASKPRRPVQVEER